MSFGGGNRCLVCKCAVAPYRTLCDKHRKKPEKKASAKSAIALIASRERRIDAKFELRGK